MDANEFINLLNNPEKVEGKSVEELKKLASEYPFSQPVQLLYAIRLSQSSEYLFNRQLGKTSILTDDRSVLFDLFEREPDEAVEGSLELSLDEKLRKEFSIEESKPEKDESLFPRDQIEQKLVQKPLPPVPESKQVIPPKVEKTSDKEIKQELKPLASKPDLSKLSPSERVKAILEENRRLREEFAERKTGEPISGPPKPIVEEKAPESEVEENIIEKPSTAVEAVQETVSQEEITEVLQDSNAEDVSELKEPQELEESSPVEIPVFTIEEEKQEPVFEIGEEDFQEEETIKEESFDEAPAEEEEVEISFEPIDKEENPQEEEDTFVKSAHSFGGWLKHLSLSEKDAPNNEEAKTAKDKPSLDEKINLLDKFVEKLPELKQKARFQVKQEPAKESINMNRLMDDNDDGSMVTETLARVYIKQKHYDKAIKAYEIMKLKYPEKSSFFADQISEIKKLSNSK